MPTSKSERNVTGSFGGIELGARPVPTSADAQGAQEGPALPLPLPILGQGGHSSSAGALVTRAQPSLCPSGSRPRRHMGEPRASLPFHPR